MRLRLPLLACSFAALAACASYHATEIRVMSNRGGGIADATVRCNARTGDDADARPNGRTIWRTDAAGRARIELKDTDRTHWWIDAPGFRPLVVTASADEIRVKQYGRRGTNHDAEPLIFVLEQNPPNAASDPKQFESQVDKAPKEKEPVQEKKEEKKKDRPPLEA